MTRFELYDLAAKAWGCDPAVVCFGDRHVVGRWVKLNEHVGHVILAARRNDGGSAGAKGVEVMGEGGSWLEAAAAAGLTGEPR